MGRDRTPWHIGGIKFYPGYLVVSHTAWTQAEGNGAFPIQIIRNVKIAADGSQAAIVPARRAMTWQLADTNGAGVVRERYWLTFAPGEIRTCASCHGVNETTQANGSA